MKLNKEQVLDLIKVLSHYDTLCGTSGVDAPSRRAIQGMLEDFILGEDKDDDDDDLVEGDDDEEDEEDDGSSEIDPEEEDSEEPDEQEDDEGDEDDDEGDGDDEEDLDVEAYVDRSDLHDLKVAKGKIISSSAGDPDDEVTLEFESLAGGDAVICDLLVNGEAVGPITHVRRKGTELHVAEDNSGERAWHRFHVARFPKGWADTLILDELCEIE
jgi:hypothetical protein